MRLAFFINNLTGSGGTQRMLTLLCNLLIEKHHILILLCRDGDSFFPLDKRVEIARVHGSHWQRNRQIYRFLKKDQTDFYINLDSNSVLLNGFFLPRHTKLWIWEHFSLENNFKKWLYSLSRYYTALRAQKIIVLSKIEKQLWQKKYKASTHQLTVIYNPVSLTAPPEGQEKKQPSHRVLAIGNKTRVKGFDILLHAWKQLDTDWALDIVGLPHAEQEALTRLIKQNDLQHIHLYPKVSTIEDFYRKADIFVLSSRREATPLVLMESQAHGLPVVAFDQLSSVKEIAGDSVLYADYRKKETALAAQLQKLIHSRELYDYYRAKSRQNVKRFSKSNFKKEWTDLITAASAKN